MAKRKKRRSRTYKLAWEFLPRVATEHLGTHKYPTSTKALRELVANSLDAAAKVVRVDIDENEALGIRSITITDDGKGISPAVLKERFRLIGIGPDNSDSSRLGRFGIGRLAVHRLGTLSNWSSVTEDRSGKRVRISFSMTASSQEAMEPLRVTETIVDRATPTGTIIVIQNIRENAYPGLTRANIAADLEAHFCSFLLSNTGRRIIVQDEVVDVRRLVQSEEVEQIAEDDSGKVPQATITHLLLKRAVDESRFPGQLVFASRGATVTAYIPDRTPSPQYLGIVESDFLNEIVSSDREAVIGLDPRFVQLRAAAIRQMYSFGERMKQRLATTFIERARSEEFYPFRSPSKDPVVSVEQAVYDVVLEKLNESANIQGMTKRQQEVIFRLLRRALVNENIFEVLDEVARLSDADILTFRRVLERTTLDCIIKLSSEVTGRLQFLDFLHQLVYGPDSKRVKERSQLHKIVEPHCWIFGARFHLAASDECFRNVVRKHRGLAGLADADDSQLAAVPEFNLIPDLFLAASRNYHVHPKHHHVLVELKAPLVKLGSKERDQIRKYAKTIRESEEFDKESTHWDLFLVSAKVTDEIEDDRKQKDKPHGVLWEWDDMRVWALSWAEIEQKARDELLLVKEHLRMKSRELNVREYLGENFPGIVLPEADVQGTSDGENGDAGSPDA